MSLTETLSFEDSALAATLFGPLGANLELLSEASGVRLDARGASLRLEYHDQRILDLLLNLLTQAYALLQEGRAVSGAELLQGLEILRKDARADLRRIFRESGIILTGRKNISPRNESQRLFLDLMRRNELVFGVGPAGTGKTYLAVAMALACLAEKKVSRIILTRPAVEAGERLGFLPGDMEEKVNPYLRPLYDAMSEMLGPAALASRQESGVIEVAPLAFMRGRTLNNAFLILDEAQNTTREQMKMFLTRLGEGSRAVVTGDITQIDLPQLSGPWLRQGEKEGETRSGLVQALEILRNVKGIGFQFFSGADVVRHPLVGRIVHAYEKHEPPVSSHAQASSKAPFCAKQSG